MGFIKYYNFNMRVCNGDTGTKDISSTCKIHYLFYGLIVVVMTIVSVVAVDGVERVKQCWTMQPVRRLTTLLNLTVMYDTGGQLLIKIRTYPKWRS